VVGPPEGGPRGSGSIPTGYTDDMGMDYTEVVLQLSPHVRDCLSATPHIKQSSYPDITRHQSLTDYGSALRMNDFPTNLREGGVVFPGLRPSLITEKRRPALEGELAWSEKTVIQRSRGGGLNVE